MISKFLKFLALLLVAFPVVSGTAHAATPTQTPAIFASPIPQVDTTTTFTTDADCYTNRCDWSLSYPNRFGQLVNGGQLGTGASATKTFTLADANRAYEIIKVKVTQPGPTNNFTLGQFGFKVYNPASAPARSQGVGGPCMYSYYGAPAYKTFVSCGVGSYYAFHGHVNCGIGLYGDGPWQTHVGPWYGSMAVCPAGSYVIYASAIFAS